MPINLLPAGNDGSDIDFYDISTDWLLIQSRTSNAGRAGIFGGNIHHRLFWKFTLHPAQSHFLHLPRVAEMEKSEIWKTEFQPVAFIAIV